MNTIIFKSVSASNPTDYIKTTLTNWSKQEVGHPTFSEALIQHNVPLIIDELGATLPLISEADIPNSSEVLTEEFATKKACYVNNLRKLLPLHGNEELISHEFVYFSQPYGDIAKGAIALKRITNQSELVLVTDNWSFTEQSIAYQTNLIDEDTVGNQRPLLKNPMAAKIAGQLLGAILSKLGAALFEKIFPPSPPSYFAEVYKEIERIVHKEITQNTIDQLNGQINGLQQWVQNTYFVEKESGKYSKEELTAILTPQVNDLAIKVIGVLEEDSFKEMGITVFMVASCMHIALLQELAVVDPKAATPAKSIHAHTIQKYADNYAEFLRATFEGLIKKREGMFSVYFDSEEICVGARCHSKPGYSWRDSFTKNQRRYPGHRDKKDTMKYHDGRVEANAGCKKEKVKVVAKLTEDLGFPMKTVEGFKELAKKPFDD